jgi:hypothetical protein
LEIDRQKNNTGDFNKRVYSKKSDEVFETFTFGMAFEKVVQFLKKHLNECSDNMTGKGRYFQRLTLAIWWFCETDV